MTEHRLNYESVMRGAAEARALGMPRLQPLPTELNEEDRPEYGIRADCELLWDYWLWDYWLWDNRGRGLLPAAMIKRRTDILTFVLNQRGIVEWPEWGDEWIAGGDGV